ncbi:Rne/Rng family ribonuclease [Desulfonatronovibrio hydrogenovorans]|uniref:Rne/Rng family ribonuclease n=1 Tax=Desulfonatronovibrio hydrogenovorans TaxID=53245 RepID=UPI000557CA1F|nr:Rne/Rng family ribonuclease [Desulfonatronovibrio hydrogenovorans]
MAVKKRRRKMFISVLPGEQIELILALDGVIQEYYVEMLNQSKTKGNIYKAKIHNIDQALQAAFINYGASKNGFLQVDEIHPEYYQSDIKPLRGNKYPPLQRVLKPGQELLVQVVKEPTGNKGAFLTTYLSFPGRYFVLTPGREQLGISRKIEDEKERERLKSIVQELKLDEGLGVIVRTVSEARNKTCLSRDLQFLKRLWKEVRKKGMAEKAPSLVYEEKDLAFRAIRDYLTEDVSEVWVDHEQTAAQVQEFAALVFPRRKKMVRIHSDPERTLLERFNLEKQLSQIFSREVDLPSGGQLVFDQAEALMAVDINSGKIGGEKDFKEMAFRTNLEAARSIPHQLMLRDVGGQVVIDFIEMKDKKHVNEVEKALKTAVKADKARTDVNKMSRFGLVEMVRQRLGTSALSVTMRSCPVCEGTGMVRNMEWQALQSLKEIYRLLRRKNCPSPLEYTVDKELAVYLLNRKRDKLFKLEEKFDRQIFIVPHE